MVQAAGYTSNVCHSNVSRLFLGAKTESASDVSKLVLEAMPPVRESNIRRSLGVPGTGEGWKSWWRNS